MTKSEFVESISRKHGLPLAYAEKILNAVLDSIEDGLFKDGRIGIKGFGSLETRLTAARNGRNPLTGEPLHIEAAKTVRFRPAAHLKAELNR